MTVACSNCGASAPITVTISGTATKGWKCPSCLAREANDAAENLTHLREAARNIILTTTHGIDGHVVTRYLGIESVEFVIGTGVFSEVSTALEDLVGRRSSAFEAKLQEAKRVAFEAFALRAAERGANAVVGVDLDYTEFSGDRVGLVVSGTCVVIAPSAAATEQRVVDRAG